jgi:hypothetical protein
MFEGISKIHFNVAIAMFIKKQLSMGNGQNYENQNVENQKELRK